MKKKENTVMTLDQLEQLIRAYQDKGRAGIKEAFPGLKINTAEARLENVDFEEDALAAAYPNLPKDEPALIAESFCEQVALGNRDMSALLSELAALKKKRGQAVPLRSYSDDEKKQYVLACYDKGLPEGVTQAEQLLYVLFLDELCGKKDPEALRIKITHLTGTDGVYAPNRRKAAEMLKELIQKEGDPALAGWLGRLYKEGLAPGEKPDYGKAFYYLSIGAAAGFAEARYLISDLFLRGAGVPLNRTVAGEILQELMEALYPEVIYGEYENTFPEVAYRMGNLLAGEPLPPGLPLYYYLLAEHALTERRAVFEDEEDRTLSAQLAKVIGRRPEKLPKTLPYEDLGSFFTPWDESIPRTLELKVTYLKRSVKLELRDLEEDGGFLAVSPENKLCVRMKKAVFTAGEGFSAEETPACRKTANGFIVRFDAALGGELYLDGEKVAAINGSLELKL